MKIIKCMVYQTDQMLCIALILYHEFTVLNNTNFDWENQGFFF